MIQTHQVSSDSIGQALQEVFAAPAYQWDRPRSIFDLVGEWLLRVGEAFQRLQESHPLAYYVVLGLLTGLLFAILAHFSYLVWRVIRASPETGSATLPKRVFPHDARWFMSETNRLMREGYFTEALASRFRALLLSLDQRQVVRFHPSKTPAEYLPEIRLDNDQRRVFGGLIGELYRHLFGGKPCTETEVRRFDEVAADLEGHVAPR